MKEKSVFLASLHLKKRKTLERIVHFLLSRLRQKRKMNWSFYLNVSLVPIERRKFPFQLSMDLTSSLKEPTLFTCWFLNGIQMEHFMIFSKRIAIKRFSPSNKFFVTQRLWPMVSLISTRLNTAPTVSFDFDRLRFSIIKFSCFFPWRSLQTTNGALWYKKLEYSRQTQRRLLLRWFQSRCSLSSVSETIVEQKEKNVRISFL